MRIRIQRETRRKKEEVRAKETADRRQDGHPLSAIGYQQERVWVCKSG
jgi:hypothetical protein